MGFDPLVWCLRGFALLAALSLIAASVSGSSEDGTESPLGQPHLERRPEGGVLDSPALPCSTLGVLIETI
jgi:hypothetical protein